jgi:hypothetical protein
MVPVCITATSSLMARMRRLAVITFGRQARQRR